MVAYAVARSPQCPPPLPTLACLHGALVGGTRPGLGLLHGDQASLPTSPNYTLITSATARAGDAACAAVGAARAPWCAWRLALGLPRSRGQWLSPPPLRCFLHSFSWQWGQMSHLRGAHPNKEAPSTPIVGQKSPRTRHWKRGGGGSDGHHPLAAHPELRMGGKDRIWGWVGRQGTLGASPGWAGDAETCRSPVAMGSSAPRSVAGHAGPAARAGFKSNLLGHSLRGTGARGCVTSHQPSCPSPLPAPRTCTAPPPLAGEYF